jgi:hypothetical protein
LNSMTVAASEVACDCLRQLFQSRPVQRQRMATHRRAHLNSKLLSVGSGQLVMVVHESVATHACWCGVACVCVYGSPTQSNSRPTVLLAIDPASVDLLLVDFEHKYPLQPRRRPGQPYVRSTMDWYRLMSTQLSTARLNKILFLFLFLASLRTCSRKPLDECGRRHRRHRAPCSPSSCRRRCLVRSLLPTALKVRTSAPARGQASMGIAWTRRLIRIQEQAWCARTALPRY